MAGQVWLSDGFPQSGVRAASVSSARLTRCPALPRSKPVRRQSTVHRQSTVARQSTVIDMEPVAEDVAAPADTSDTQVPSPALVTGTRGGAWCGVRYCGRCIVQS